MKTELTEAMRERINKIFEITAEDVTAIEANTMRDELIALAAFRKGQSNPKIKQLEWDGKEELAFFTAKTNIGEYMIDSPHNDGIFVLMSTPDWSDESFVLHTSDSVDELKCFAQQDFERRVRECLE